MDTNAFSLNIGKSPTILHRNVTYDDSPTTCTRGESNHLARNVFVVSIPVERQKPYQDAEVERGQIDTGA